MTSGQERLPGAWEHLMTGRVVQRGGRTGVVMFWDSAQWGHQDAKPEEVLGGVAVKRAHKIAWDDGEMEVLSFEETQRIATPRFLEASWVHAVPLYLQRRQWVGHDRDLDKLKDLAKKEQEAEAKNAATEAKKAAAAEKRRKGKGVPVMEGGKAGSGGAVAPKAKKAGATVGGGKGKAGAGPTSLSGKKKRAALENLKFKNPGLEQQLYARLSNASAKAAASAGAAAPSSLSGAKPAAAAARLQLAQGAAQQQQQEQQALGRAADQDASNSVPVAASAAAAGEPPVDSPRAGARPAPEAGAASMNTTCLAVADGKRGDAAGKKRSARADAAGAGAKKARAAAPGGSGKKGAGASKRLSPMLAQSGAVAATEASAVSQDVLSIEEEDLLQGQSYSQEPVLVAGEEAEQPMEVKFFRYNLRMGSDGKLYRVYSADIIVLDSLCYSSGKDSRCRSWKQEPAQDQAYAVERIVAERHFPGVWSTVREEWKIPPGTQYLVKWEDYELDLSAETDKYQVPGWEEREEAVDAEEAESSWLFAEDLCGAQATIRAWKKKGRAEFVRGVSLFAAAAAEPAAAAEAQGH